MRFGLGPLSIEKVSNKTHVDVYEDALEQSVAAEWWGFDSVWVDEKNFSSSSFNSSASVIAAAISQRTAFVRSGMMPLMGLVNAIYLAEEAACVDNISNGRLIFAGQVPSDSIARGWAGSNSPERIQDDIQVLRKAWGGNPFSHHSEFHNIPGEMAVHTIAAGLHKISVQPKPAQLTMPLWLTGNATASDVAHSEGLPYFGPAILTRTELKAFYQEHTQSSNPAKKFTACSDCNCTSVSSCQRIVPLAREVFIAPTTEKAHELAESAITELYKSFVSNGDLKDFKDFKELAKNRFIIGDPDTCIEEIYKYQEELGINYMVARLSYHNMHPGETIKAIQLFGKAVIPEFRMFGLPDEIRKVL